MGRVFGSIAADAPADAYIAASDAPIPVPLPPPPYQSYSLILPEPVAVLTTGAIPTATSGVDLTVAVPVPVVEPVAAVVCFAIDPVIGVPAVVVLDNTEIDRCFSPPVSGSFTTEPRLDCCGVDGAPVVFIRMAVDAAVPAAVVLLVVFRFAAVSNEIDFVTALRIGVTPAVPPELPASPPPAPIGVVCV